MFELVGLTNTYVNIITRRPLLYIFILELMKKVIKTTQLSSVGVFINLSTITAGIIGD